MKELLGWYGYTNKVDHFQILRRGCVCVFVALAFIDQQFDFHIVAGLCRKYHERIIRLVWLYR